MLRWANSSSVPTFRLHLLAPASNVRSKCGVSGHRFPCTTTVNGLGCVRAPLVVNCTLFMSTDSPASRQSVSTYIHVYMYTYIHVYRNRSAPIRDETPPSIHERTVSFEQWAPETSVGRRSSKIPPWMTREVCGAQAASSAGYTSTL